MRNPPDGKGRSSPGAPLGPTAAAANAGSSRMLPERADDRHRARVEQQRQRLRVARLAHQAMPLSVYYGPRPLRDVPLAQLLGEGGLVA